eukprot:1195884-Prorocentrum_minimum.AAC.5
MEVNPDDFARNMMTSKSALNGIPSSSNFNLLLLQDQQAKVRCPQCASSHEMVSSSGFVPWGLVFADGRLTVRKGSTRN